MKGNEKTKHYGLYLSKYKIACIMYMLASCTCNCVLVAAPPSDEQRVW